MKKFIQRLLLWAAIVYLLALGVDFMISSGLRKTDIRKYAVWNDIYHKNIHSDLLVIGSSRAWCGYDTYILDSILGCNSYNLGLDGHALDAQIIRYNTYKRFCELPTNILINIDMLSTFGNSSDGQYEREQYFPYILDDSLISVVKKGKEISFFDRYIPLFRYYGYRNEINDGISAFWGKRDFFDGGMYKGYRGNNYEWSEGILSKDTVVDVSLSLRQSYIDMLKDFINQMKRDGINVILVKSPVYSPLFSKLMNVEKSDSVFLSVSNICDVPILDYYHMCISDDSSYFYNSSHMNTKGAEAFTLQLAHDIDSLGLLKK